MDQPTSAVTGLRHNLKDGTRAFAMITCPPNSMVAPVHPKAMVTVLAWKDHDRWLRGGLDDALDLQRPYFAEQMAVRGPVFPTRAAA